MGRSHYLEELEADNKMICDTKILTSSWKHFRIIRDNSTYPPPGGGRVVSVCKKERVHESIEVTLPSGNSTTITFAWNITGVAKGNYTIRAYAEPVLGETDTADNTFTDGWIIVAFVGRYNRSRRMARW